MRNLRKLVGWIFAIECWFFSLVTWIVHYPPQDGQPFIRGGYESSWTTIIAVSAFYFAISATLGIGWWTTWKEKLTSRYWGLSASVASLFTYVDPSYWYQIQRKGVWVHWMICLLGLVVFLIPQTNRSAGDIRPANIDEHLPSAGVCYAWGIVFPLFYLFARQRKYQNTFLRFHCIQCLSLFFLGVLCFLVQERWTQPSASVPLLIVGVSYFVALISAVFHTGIRLPLISIFADWLS